MSTSPGAMGSMFGSSPSASPSQPSPSQVQPGQAGPQPQPSGDEGMSAGRQLITQVAEVHSKLKGLASAYPEMSQSIEKAIAALREGMTKSIGGMQSKGSEGGSPPYA